MAVLVEVDGEDVKGRHHLQKRVHHARPVIESFHQVVDGLDGFFIEAVLVIKNRRVVVDAFAESFHQRFVRRDVSHDYLVLLLVLAVMVLVVV